MEVATSRGPHSTLLPVVPIKCSKKAITATLLAGGGHFHLLENRTEAQSDTRGIRIKDKIKNEKKGKINSGSVRGWREEVCEAVPETDVARLQSVDGFR